MSVEPEVLLQRMVTLRRALHRHPELSGEEHQTAATILNTLRAAGLPGRLLGTHGVICDLPGQHSGPRVALRADTDALPVQEATGLDFASQRPGHMHACGHDGHTAILLGAALRLAEHPAPGPVRCIWQPAEESGLGAQQLIAAGVLDGVAQIYGGHIDPRYPSGHILVTEGGVNASTDHLIIDLWGQGGHGARPHECRDALLAACELVVALQRIVAREIDPGQPAVVTVGQLVAGTGNNIIAHAAHLEGTLRAHDPQVRAQLAAAVRRCAAAVAAQAGVTVDVQVVPGTPAVINLPAPTRIAREAAIEAVGADRVGTMRQVNMGGEDFAAFLQHVPGCYVRFGAARPGVPFAPAHSGGFDFHEPAMLAAAAWMEAVARHASQQILLSA